MTSSKHALTRRDFDEVMRRAAELAADEPESTDRGFSDGEVIRIGREVGLPDRHVRQALSEVRSGRTVARPAGWGGVRALFGKGRVFASRVIERPRETIRRELDDFMVAGQLLQAVRKRDDFLQYRPSVDWASRVARAASSQGRQHYVAAARLVEVRLEKLDESSTLVEINVDPGVIDDFRAGAVGAGGVVGAASGIGVVALLTPLWPVALAVGLGVVVGSIGTGLVAALSGRGLARRISEIRSEVEGILDGLESGVGLEPPPPAWRRWVRRHFHGVAREMLGPGQQRRE
ncbi:MAG: hypothetical protein ACR2QM_02370 [Longimicrobiales bacterium]